MGKEMHERFFDDSCIPHKCAACGKTMPGKRTEMLCETCDRQLHAITEPRCKRCSKPVDDLTQELCEDCAKESLSYRAERHCTAMMSGCSRSSANSNTKAVLKLEIFCRAHGAGIW